MSLKILLFGKPGAGKDTQAVRLAEYFHLAHFSAGDLLRKEVASQSDLGKMIAPYVERGEIVPNGVAGKLMKAHILSEEVQKRGYVIISYPRKVESFQEYLTHDTPTLVIVLDVSEEEARKRLLLRKRSDDTEEAIATRLRIFHEMDEQLFAWLVQETKIPTFFCDASRSIPEVTTQLIELISTEV